MDTFHSLLQKIFKFGLVGLAGVCVDFFFTWLLKEKLKLNKYVANGTGFSLAVINNFVLNYIWTFKGSEAGVGTAFGLFVIISIVGLLLNSLFVYIFHDLKNLNFYLSKILAVFFVFFWNFGANYFFNFHALNK